MATAVPSASSPAVPASATATPYASASLYVGDLNPEVTEALLFEFFNAVGPVASVRVCRDAATRRSLGYAYVNFHRPDDAERALDTMNFTPIRGRPCRIMWSHRDPSLRKSGLGNIFVKNLAKTIDNKALYDTFSVFGNILSCKVAVNQKRESLGYGFVHYESEESAQNAIERVNGMVIAGEKVTVQAFKSKKERGGADKNKYTNVYVKNLPEDTTKESLDALFSKHGKITSSMLVIDEEKKKCRGFGFVNFETPEMATAAVQGLNNMEQGAAAGKKLVVCRAQKKEEREKELRERFEQWKLERQKKYAGINLYVKNLADNIDDARLRSEFSKFGNITSARVMSDEAQKSRGFGFVCFSTPEEATKAVTDMNGHMLEGKPLYVALAQRKEVRRAQLEAQYAVRVRQAAPNMQAGPMPPAYMAPPQGAPIFYAQGGMGPIPGGPRNFAYPPQQRQQMVGRWAPNPGQMMGMPQPGNFQLMPVPQRGQPAPRGRGQRGPHGRVPNKGGQPPMQGRRPQGNQNLPYKYGANVRNPAQAPQPAPGPVVGTVPAEAVAAAPAQPAAPAVAVSGQEPLSLQTLAAASPELQKQMIGERLFPLIQQHQPELAGKITGMLLEMENGELLHLIESPDSLRDKVTEALAVLQTAGSDVEQQQVTAAQPAAQ